MLTAAAESNGHFGMAVGRGLSEMSVANNNKTARAVRSASEVQESTADGWLTLVLLLRLARATINNSHAKGVHLTFNMKGDAA
ncbi:hypothetical protein DdX_03461 [Ditylenchus destructor]|uniref:Uncharacterized protein n=1 Tax=Ditylenchus destructor TaxID=166010 RepID=A0AAD4R810_9BILA|nr:hypothetical protein DdX_03461 [Ditylenchus destructor]